MNERKLISYLCKALPGILLFCILSFAKSSFSQPNIDSLRGVWQNETLEDTVRLNAFQEFIYTGYLYNQPDSAFHYADIMEQMCKGDELEIYRSNAINIKGVSFYLRSDLDLAEKYWLESFHIREKIGDSKQIALSLNNLGIVYSDRCEFEKALEYFEKSVEMNLANNLPDGASRAYNNIGTIYGDLTEYAKALEYFYKSAEIKRKFGKSVELGNTISNIAVMHMRQGDTTEALTKMTEALDLRKELKDYTGIASSQTTIAKILIYQGEYDSAFTLINSSYNLARAGGSKNFMAFSLSIKAFAFSRQGELDSAIFYSEKSTQLQIEIENYTKFIPSILNTGSLYYLKGDYKKASELAKDGYEKALTHNLRADQILGKILMFSIENKRGEYKNAYQHIKELMQLRVRDIELNMSVLPDRERELYFATMNTEFDMYYDFALRYQDKIPEVCNLAYNFALLTKGILLKSNTMMRNIILSSGDAEKIEQYNTWISLQHQIVRGLTEGKDVQELEKTAEELERQLVKSSLDFEELISVKKMNWEQVRDGLKENEAMIEFVRFRSNIDFFHDTASFIVYGALIVQKNSEHPTFVELCKEDKLNEIIGSFPGNNLSYINQLYGTKDQPETRLYELIWAPLEKELATSEKIYLSPVGLLHKISFSALAKEKGIYLSDLYDIDVVSSTGSVHSTSKIADKVDGVASIFGGIDYNTDSSKREIWKYLEGSLAESKEIKKTLDRSGREVNYFNHVMATEEQFKKVAPSSRILHIATHGFFFHDPKKILKVLEDSEESREDIIFRGGGEGMGVSTFVKSRDPLMRSGLVFAGANDVWSRSGFEGEDGVLTAAEVSTIDLRNTELVVLSACETGLGDIKGSEGVYGLQRAFKMAGVHYMVMSLWQVPDKETAEFMILFYKHLSKLKDIRKAFANAQSSMRAKYDPYFWAAFVLVE